MFPGVFDCVYVCVNHRVLLRALSICSISGGQHFEECVRSMRARIDITNNSIVSYAHCVLICHLKYRSLNNDTNVHDARTQSKNNTKQVT
jgi:hypothetical protein